MPADPSPLPALLPSRVACATVSYYSGEHLLTLIDSLRRGTRQPEQIIVVNNAVDDELTEIRAIAGVSVLDAGRNLGYGGAINLAVEGLPESIRWILVANPDIVVEPDTLELLLRSAVGHGRAGALGPVLTDSTGVVYPSARSLPSLGTGIGHALLGRRLPSNPWSRRYWGSRRMLNEPVREVGWLSGAFVLIDRAAFDEIGGFDPGYFMYFEDVDLGRRLGDAGWANLYVTEAVVVHHGAHSTRRAAEAMNLAHHRSAYRYLAGRYHHWWQAPLRTALWFGLRLRAIATSSRHPADADEAEPHRGEL